MDNPEHILVVDDDPEIRTLLKKFLINNGFPNVSTAEDGRETREILGREEITLIVLDIMLPREDGFSIAKSIRQDSEIPIIIVSALNNLDDKVLGLNMGADDYLTKPFDTDELLARIHAILRRLNGGTADGEQKFRIGDITLSMPERTIIRNDQKEVPLSGSEFGLLSLFLHHPNQPLSRKDITVELTGGVDFVSERTIDVQISRLRNRLGDSGGDIIKTLRNEGYILASSVIPPYS